MARHATSVRQVASTFDLDLEEALVTLWDAGFEEIDDIDDRIPAARVSAARRALGLETEREVRTVKYWQRQLKLGPEEFRARLADLGVALSPQARVLPKGALSRLKSAGVQPERQLVPAVVSAAPALLDPTADVEPFEWRCVGAPRACEHLTIDEVRRVHEALEDEFRNSPDPVEPPGLRDEGLLDSAVHRAMTSLGNELKYPSAEMVAAALLHSLIHNHPFFNGNKRAALVAMLVSLDRNGLLLTCDERTLFRYVLRIAQHRVAPPDSGQLADREVLAIAQWICDNSRSLSKGERRLKWRQLRQALTRFDCTFEGPLPGNKMKVRRVVTSRGFLGRPKRRELIAHAWYGGEGRDVAPEHVQFVRQCLELNDEAGYDSAYFYGTDPREPDEFIAEYRNILRRLARL